MACKERTGWSIPWLTGHRAICKVGPLDNLEQVRDTVNWRSLFGSTATCRGEGQRDPN
jgi:hypothetical protein